MSEIVVENLSKTFLSKDGTVEALKNVSLQIESGDIYGIIGMSGAGKSTLVRCMNFLEAPSEGRVLVNGKSLGDYSEKELRKQRESIGMIFQHFNLLMQKSVLENVCFPLYIQGKKKNAAHARALELLEIVGLSEKQNAYPAQLSGGQKQRVAIARALACDPKILLCDEATSALDPQTTVSILELLKDINRRFHITIVVITHQMSVVREICNRVAILKDGVVADEGLVSDIFTNPKSAVARELILGDSGNDLRTKSSNTPEEIQSGEKIRIVFSENSAFEPVIANLVLTFGEPVNILRADTKNVGGVAKGEMILEFLTPIYKILDVIANIVRSVPFLILLIMIIPFTRIVAGKSYGSTATIVPLTVAAIPFIARMVESSLKEVDPGVIEAARSMGAGTLRIVFKVMLVEARTSLIVNGTIALGTILGYTAMSGAVGGGGLGDIAVRYGYHRWQTDIMIVTVILLIILFQLFQTIGMAIANRLDKRK